MNAEELHFPDFDAPDFTQPVLQQADLAMPGFTLPDPALPEPVIARRLRLGPDEMDRPAPSSPGMDSPDLTEPEVSADLARPAPDAHALPEPEYAPDVVMRQRPGELDPAAAELLLKSPDLAELPARLTYPQLYTSADEMSTRKRHLGMLELGLERDERGGR